MAYSTSNIGQTASHLCTQQRVLWATIIVVCGAFIYSMWFGMNSDHDNVHPLLTQLIPAGHCTCQTSTSFQCSDCFTCLASSKPLPGNSSSPWEYQYGRDDRNLGLSKAQCKASFPGLFQDIHRGVEFWKRQGGVTDESLGAAPLKNGMAQAIIHDGELYVVAARAMGKDHRRKIVATLSAMYWLLFTSTNCATTLNIEFIFSVEDRVDDVGAVGHPIWVFSRKASEESVWLMPDFRYWLWGHLSNNIRPYRQAVDHVLATESSLPFLEKTKKLIWQGKLSFAPKLRCVLLDTAQNQEWGNVKELDWSKKANFLSMEDHCKYMFIRHVEGIVILSFFAFFHTYFIMIDLCTQQVIPIPHHSNIIKHAVQSLSHTNYSILNTIITFSCHQGPIKTMLRLKGTSPTYHR